MKKFIAFLSALLVAIVCVLCLNRVPVGYVGVVYSSSGVEQKTLSQGWHFLSPMKHVSKFPMIRLIMARRNTRIGTLMHPPVAEWLALT